MPGEPLTPNVNMIDARLREVLANPQDPFHAFAVEFFLHLAVNHSVICERKPDGSTL